MAMARGALVACLDAIVAGLNARHVAPASVGRVLIGVPFRDRAGRPIPGFEDASWMPSLVAIGKHASWDLRRRDGTLVATLAAPAGGSGTWNYVLARAP